MALTVVPMPHTSTSTDAFELRFLELLGAHKRGNPEAAEEIFQLLKTPERLDLNRENAPLLISALKVENETIRVVVNNALSSLGEGAVGAVATLRELALNVDEDDFSSLSAVKALGGIPGDASLEALVCIVESADSLDSTKLEHAIDALVSHGAAVDPYLSRIESALDRFNPEDGDCVRLLVVRLRCAVRLSESAARGELVLPGDFDFTEDGLTEEGDLNLETLEPRTLPAGYGLLVDDRISFVQHGHGDVGLEIFRLEKNSDRYVVILSQDGQSGVSCVSDALEYLASVVSAMYDLDPERTLWAERVTFDSGLLEEDEAYSIVTFREFDPWRLRFRWPDCEPVASRDVLFDRA